MWQKPDQNKLRSPRQHGQLANRIGRVDNLALMRTNFFHLWLLFSLPKLIMRGSGFLRCRKPLGYYLMRSMNTLLQ